MPHPIPAALVSLAALLLPAAVAAPAAPAEAAGAVTATTITAAPAAAPQHTRRWRHCHTRTRPCDKRKPAPHVTNARAKVVKAAKRYLGRPYSYGNLDCSGLTQRAFRAAGVHLPRTAAAQARKGHATHSPRPGDLLVYRTRGVVTHVAVVARTKGRAVIDTIVSPHTGGFVEHQKPYQAYEVRALLA